MYVDKVAQSGVRFMRRLLRKYLAVTNDMNIPEKVENVSTAGFFFVFVEIPVVEMQGFGFYFVN